MRLLLAFGLALSPLLVAVPAHAQDDKEWPPPSDDTGGSSGNETTTPSDEPTEPVPPPPPSSTSPVVRTQPAPAAPPPALEPAQRDVDPRIRKRFILDGFLHLGFGGSFNVVDVNGFDADLSNDLGASLGGGVRGTFVIGNYFGVGPMIRVSGVTVQAAPSGTGAYLLADAEQTAVDIDASLMGRFPLGFMDVYAVVPLGLTVTNFTFNDTSNVGAGWNIGVLGGARFWLGSVFNLFVELGFTYRSTSESVFGRDEDGILGTDSITAQTIQGTLQVGASIGF